MVFANLPYTYNLAHLKCQPPPHPASNGGGQGGPSLPCNPGTGPNQGPPGSGANPGGPPNGPGPPQPPTPMTNGNAAGSTGPDDGSSGYGSADSNFDGK